MESRAVPPPQASARQTEMGEAFNRILFAATEALEEQKIPYAMIGGIAAIGLGRPRSTHDIDFFIRPEDAEVTLEALKRHGFDTERTDDRWLYKGFKEQMMVDIIFKSSGDIYFDSEMQERAKPVDFHGRKIKVVSPEDLIIIKCAVHSEIGPHHWHDALAVLSHATLDWKYLIKRSRKAPRRLLALLVYAQSNDILIPNTVICELFESVFGDQAKTQSQGWTSENKLTSREPKIPQKTDLYLLSKIQRAIATDQRTSTLDVKLNLIGHRIVASGELSTPELKRNVEAVINECASDYSVDNRISVSEPTEPQTVEELT